MPLTIAESLVKTKQEGLVFADWAAEGSAELILLEGFGAGSEKVGGVEDVVPEKLPQGPVNLIGAGARNNVGGGTKAVAEFGVGVMREDAEFGDGINGRFEDEAAVDAVEVVGAIDLGYYGWCVALAGCLGVMGGFGSLFVYTFTVFVKPLGAEFGWNRESVSLGFAIAAMTVGLSSPLIGRLIDRVGPRRIILPCMTVFGFGVASLGVLHRGLWQFYLTCFVIGVVGNGAAHLAYARSISTWFDRRLGTAFAFVMVGAGLGRSGWRSAYVSLGVLALLLGLPLSWRYIVERGPAQRESAPVAHSGLTWRQGTRSFPFWIIVAVLFVSSISMNGAITHLSALLTDRGISPWHAALCASILGGFKRARPHRNRLAA